MGSPQEAQARMMRGKTMVSRVAKLVWTVAGGIVPLMLTARAWAQASLDDYDWRQEHRRRQSPQSWEFELRFGPYYPNVDQEFAGKGYQPYHQVFGNGSRFFFGVELDYQAVRIPNVGSLGPGMGWGYTSASSNAKLSGTNIDSAETTGLWIMPMYLVGVLRLDTLPNDWGIPVVPYAKAGFGYALWKASNELGTSTYQGVDGKGHSYGLHLAGGLALQLDFLDTASAQQLDNSIGINHAYGYFEWVWSDLGGLGQGQMRVGTSSWVTGLAFEI